MNIGFDAKRAYHNFTGLGNYSRTLINAMATKFAENTYFAYNPKKTNRYAFPASSSIIEINPTSFIDTVLPSFWRSTRMAKDIASRVDVYHGLSNELPFGLTSAKLKKVVTIHDLIFEHYPNHYPTWDRMLYQRKSKYACTASDIILATSEATKKDIIDFYKIADSKIHVVYQGCDDRFYKKASKEKMEAIQKKYDLPSHYFISVGSIIERKNLLSTCKAFSSITDEGCALIIIGKGGDYKKLVQKYLHDNKLHHRVQFLEDRFPAQDIYTDLPILYAMSLALVYPSILEGFGIPVLEAMASATAVITSNQSSMQEIGNGAAVLVNPFDVEEIAYAMQKMYKNEIFRKECITLGREKCKEFDTKLIAQQVMTLYKN